jgi:hypothetical protein
MADKYRKKPVIIEAQELQWTTWNEVCDFMEGQAIRGGWVDPIDGTFTEGNMPPGHLSLADAEIGVIIETLEGDMLARQGVQGEFYPCKPDIFVATYEMVDEPAGD